MPELKEKSKKVNVPKQPEQPESDEKVTKIETAPEASKVTPGEFKGKRNKYGFIQVSKALNNALRWPAKHSKSRQGEDVPLKMVVKADGTLVITRRKA